MNEQARALAQEAIDLYEDPRSHYKFRLKMKYAIQQVVDEQDVPIVDSVGEVVRYRENLISDVTAAVETLQEA